MKWVIGAFLAAAVLTGCMGNAMVRKDAIAGTRSIAVVGVVIPRVADTGREGNRSVLQAIAERALSRVHEDLKSVPNWSVLDPADFKSSPAVMSFGSITRAEITALLPADEEMIERESSQWKRAFIGAKGLPIVPRSAFVADRKDKSPLASIPKLIRGHAARLCSILNVDAVAFVHVLADISHPRPKTFLVSGNRTDGTLRVAQTIIIVDRSGALIADTGWPLLDEHARSGDLLPVYIGSGQNAVKQENIDLADPGKKIAQVFSLLIDQTADDMISRLKKAAAR